MLTSVLGRDYRILQTQQLASSSEAISQYQISHD